jgi:hypoxanthine phosphoribosyltransferase
MTAGFDILYDEAQIAARVSGLAERLAERLTPDWTVIVLLQGAMPFAVDLMRALAAQGVHPQLDCLWLESYRDARESSGRVVVRADISRPLHGRSVLVLDDVFDTGRTIAFAKAHLLAKGAVEAQACCLVRKPGATGALEHCGFDAPDRFLVGYGMDDAGRYRGLPVIAALRSSGL